MKPLTECPKDRPVILILKKQDGSIMEQECYYNKDEPFHDVHPATKMPYAFEPIGWRESTVTEALLNACKEYRAKIEQLEIEVERLKNQLLIRSRMSI